MDNKKFIGVFHNEDDLLVKIDQLLGEGYIEEDMYVIAKDAHDISMVRGRTDVEVQSAGGSFGDRFSAFLSGSSPVRDALTRTGISEEEADRHYADIENGGMLLYVDRSYGSQYTNSTGDQGVGTTYTDSATSRLSDTDTSNDETLRLHEEQLSVNKNRVQTGEVHIEKEVFEEEQRIDVPVEREEVIVERRAVTDGEAAAGFADRAFEDDNETIRVPITEERVEVTKKPVVTEEINVEKRTVQDTETVRDTVRREEAHIEKDGNIVRDDRDLK